VHRVTLFLLCCCLLGSSMLAVAVDARGSRACAAWQEHRLEEAEGHTTQAQVDQTWLVGYLSGVVAGSGIDFLTGTDNDSLFSMADVYCQANPLGHLAQAGTAMARELMEDKGIAHVPTLP